MSSLALGSPLIPTFVALCLQNAIDFKNKYTRFDTEHLEHAKNSHSAVLGGNLNPKVKKEPYSLGYVGTHGDIWRNTKYGDRPVIHGEMRLLNGELVPPPLHSHSASCFRGCDEMPLQGPLWGIGS